VNTLTFITRCVRALAMALCAASAFAADTASSEAADWLAPALTYDGAAVANLRGGLRRGSTYVGNLHLKLTANGDPLGWPGASAFADLLTIHGGRPSQLVGDAQGVSSIEGPNGTQIEELWLQQNFQGGNASLLLGIYDLNSEFYRLQSAGLFLNSALGIGPEFSQSGVEGPSIFPRTAAGARLAIKPSASMVVRMALLDGVPVARADGSRAAFRSDDGWLGVAEVAWLSRANEAQGRQGSARDRIGRFSSLAPYGDKIAIGAWHFSGRYPDLADTDPAGQPTLHRGTSGAYALGEHLLLGGEDDAAKRLAVFMQAGVADARTNRFGWHLSAGLVASGWGLIKEADQIGVSITPASNGAHYTRSQSAQGIATGRAETTIEWTYLSQLSKHLSVQPDLQYVRHPNTDPSIADAWVPQLRFELSF
jgi:porin